MVKGGQELELVEDGPGCGRAFGGGCGFETAETADSFESSGVRFRIGVPPG